MPIYRMLCASCGHEEDIYRSLAKIDDDLPECCGNTMGRKICAPAVIADIQPYQAMGVDVATGKAPVITSRSEHRAYLRRNGYVEVGSDMPKLSERKTEGDFNVRRELTEAARAVLSQPGHVK